MKIRISLIFSLASRRVLISVGSALELKMGELNVLFIYEKVIVKVSITEINSISKRFLLCTIVTNKTQLPNLFK